MEPRKTNCTGGVRGPTGIRWRFAGTLVLLVWLLMTVTVACGGSEPTVSSPTAEVEPTATAVAEATADSDTLPSATPSPYGERGHCARHPRRPDSHCHAHTDHGATAYSYSHSCADSI